jgi:hypothetical protein
MWLLTEPWKMVAASATQALHIYWMYKHVCILHDLRWWKGGWKGVWYISIHIHVTLLGKTVLANTPWSCPLTPTIDKVLLYSNTSLHRSGQDGGDDAFISRPETGPQTDGFDTSLDQHIKPTCTKSRPTWFGTIWVPSQRVLTVVKVVADFQTMHGTHNTEISPLFHSILKHSSIYSLPPWSHENTVSTMTSYTLDIQQIMVQCLAHTSGRGF